MPEPTCITCGFPLFGRATHADWCERARRANQDPELTNPPFGEGGPASADLSTAKAPRSGSVFAKAAAEAGYDLTQPAEAAAARADFRVWDAVEAEYLGCLA